MAINQTAQPLSGPAAPPQKARTSFGILGAISLSHLLNDMIQSLILAIYPLLQAEFSLTFVQIGMIPDLPAHLIAIPAGDWLHHR